MKDYSSGKTFRCRSAVTGRFVSNRFAKKHPRSTIVERVRKRRPAAVKC